MKKAASLLLVLILTLSLARPAGAAQGGPGGGPGGMGGGSSPSQGMTQGSAPMGGNGFSGQLSSLVTAGTLTQTQADAVTAALKPSESEKPGSTATSSSTDPSSAMKTKLEALVTAGTITAEQAEAILAAIKPANQEQGKTGNQASQNRGHMRLQIGSSSMTVGSSQKQIDPGYNTAPVINNETTFVPIRAIIESLGGSLTWNSDTQTLTITLDDNTVSLTVGSSIATVNGKSVTLTNDPYISGSGRTMIPLRFIAENLGMQVNWDQNTQSIDIQQ